MAQQYDTSDFRKNLKIEVDNEPWVILEAQHVKPGKGVAIVKTRFKNLISGRVLERNFRSGDKCDVPDLHAMNAQFLYASGDEYVFMDQENFEQVSLTKDAVDEAVPWLIDNLPVTLLFFRGKAINIEVPTFVELTIVRTDPGVKGDTAQGGSKPATLQTGATVNIPLYVQEGEKIKVDTRTGTFVERVK
jgi:elongation factor P